jgi:DNA polymerase-3 subunit epsilon
MEKPLKHNNMSEKLFFFDLETTGVKFWKNSIHQISGAIVIDRELKERFNFHVQPFPSAEIEEEALKVGGVTREQILAYPAMSVIYRKLIAILGKYVDKFNKQDKFHLVGYNNASFDNPFFRAFFVQNGDQYFGSWFWSDPIDVFILAAWKLRTTRHTMASFKQSEVAKALGIKIDEEKLHDAEYDIDICMQMYFKLSRQKLIIPKKERTFDDIINEPREAVSNVF